MSGVLFRIGKTLDKCRRKRLTTKKLKIPNVSFSLLFLGRRKISMLTTVMTGI